MTERTLDLCGLKCPLPSLKTRKALDAFSTGDVLLVVCTDPMAAIDIPHLVSETGDVLLDVARSADQIAFRIRKS
jgi:tRNA 2-thiouridine synthesizing protein A